MGLCVEDSRDYFDQLYAYLHYEDAQKEIQPTHIL